MMRNGKHSAKTLLAFLSQMSKTRQNIIDQRSQMPTIYAELFPQILEKITFPRKNIEREPSDDDSSYTPWDLLRQDSWPLTPAELTTLHAGLVEQRLENEIDQLFERLKVEAEQMHPDLITPSLVAYLRGALSQLAPRGIFWHDKFQMLSTHVLDQLLLRQVRREPEPPSRVRSPMGCGCAFCGHLDLFLTSSTQDTIKIVVPYKRDITHLEKQCKPKAGYRHLNDDGELDLTPQSTRQPYTMTVEKTNGWKYRSRHRNWKERADAAQKEISTLADVNVLRILLGDRCEELMLGTPASPQQPTSQPVTQNQFQEAQLMHGTQAHAGAPVPQQQNPLPAVQGLVHGQPSMHVTQSYASTPNPHNHLMPDLHDEIHFPEIPHPYREMHAPTYPQVSKVVGRRHGLSAESHQARTHRDVELGDRH